MKAFRLLIFLLVVFNTGIASFAQAALTQIGQWQHSADSTELTKLTVEGDYAYGASSGGRLRVFDVRDRRNPIQLSLTTLTNEAGFPGTIVGNGRYLYLPLHVGPFSSPRATTNVMVVDVLDKANPRIIGSLGLTHVIALKKEGNRLYTGGKDLGIFDLTDPANPAPLGNLPLLQNTSEVIYDVAVKDGVAYVATGRNGIYIIDVLDPAHPTQLHHDPSINAYTVSLLNDRAYIGAQVVINGFYLSALNTYDISNPPSLLELDSQLIARTTTLPDISRAGNIIGAQGLRAYVVYEIAANGIPIQRAEVKSDVFYTLYDIFTTESDLFLASNRGVEVISVRSPAVPTPIGTTAIGLSGIIVQHDFAFAIDSARGLAIFDVRNPASPQRVFGFYQLGPVSFAAAGARLYVGHSAGVWIYDVANPETPQLIGSISTPLARDVKIREGFLFVAVGSEGGLRVFNVQNPATPQFVTNFMPTAVFQNIALAGDHLFSTGSSGAMIVDATEPTNLVLKQNVGHNSPAIAAFGTRMFLGDPTGLVHGFHPSFAEHISHLSVPGGGRLALSEDRLFSSSATILSLIDTRDLFNPRIATAVTVASAVGLAAQQDLAFVTTPRSLAVWDSTLPPMPDPPALPTMDIHSNNGAVVIRWPSDFTGFKLYGRPGLNSQWQFLTENATKKIQTRHL